MRKLETRKDKINFLQSLAIGKTSIDELCDKPPTVEVWKQQSDQVTYVNIKTGVSRTHAELKESDKRLKNTLRVLVRYCSIPVFKSEKESEEWDLNHPQ